MATANKMIWQALQKRCTRLRRSRNGIFFVSVDLLIHSEQYANTSMAILIRRVTCKSSFFFSLGTKKSFKLQNLPQRTSTLFISRWIGALVLFRTATKSAAVLQNIQVNLHLTHYAQGKNDTERNLCIYNVSQTFYTFLIENWKMPPI